PFELTTPTGAVLISSLSAGFGPLPEMEISKTGIGAGDRDFETQPNVLRLLLGRQAKKKRPGGEKVTVIETNIDDMNPQVYEYVMDRLFDAGALDVFLTQLVMKKSRPGIMLSVICDEGRREKLTDIILNETTSIGVRFHDAGRKTLEREIKKIDSKFGRVNVKVCRLKGNKIKSSPEYEDCKKIAKKFGVPLIEVMKVLGGKGAI
ncbi:MAG: LarC family nickel insertion protein, partial [Nitrospirota bacterium]|nr:LarC family nickel insertion protein [Nitrospirota bacterium]